MGCWVAHPKAAFGLQTFPPFTHNIRRTTSTRIRATWEGKCLPVKLSPCTQLLGHDSDTQVSLSDSLSGTQSPQREKISQVSCRSSQSLPPISVLFALLAQFRMFQTLYFALVTHLLWWCFEGNTVRLLFAGKLCFASWEAASIAHDMSHA